MVLTSYQPNVNLPLLRSQTSVGDIKIAKYGKVNVWPYMYITQIYIVIVTLTFVFFFPRMYSGLMTVRLISNSAAPMLLISFENVMDGR